MSVSSLGAVASIIARDFRGLRATCGLGVATKWLLAIARTFPECRRVGNLSPADRAMGTGPFAVRLRGARATVRGDGAFSGIREIWARDCYLGDGFLEIGPTDFVVDLGANMGNFTNLALAHGTGVRVVAVEPGLDLNRRFRESVGGNGWLDRVRLLRCIAGGSPASMPWLLADPQYTGVDVVDVDALLDAIGETPIDFLKCDIEGGEFFLFADSDRLLRHTRQIAMEIHDSAGDRRVILDRLSRAGFEMMFVSDGEGDCVVLARRPVD